MKRQLLTAQVSRRLAGKSCFGNIVAAGTSNLRAREGRAGASPVTGRDRLRRRGDGDTARPETFSTPLAAITEKKESRVPLARRRVGRHGRLMLAVLGGLADVERDLIRTPTAEGRNRAKRRGVKLGRKPKLTPEQRREAINRRDEGEETRAEDRRPLQRPPEHDFKTFSLTITREERSTRREHCTTF
jgi:resolvase-like protein